MLPRSSCENSPCGIAAYFKFFGNLLAVFIRTSDKLNQLLRKDGIVVIASLLGYRNVGPPFSVAISYVSCPRSVKKVIWVNAGWVVASMAHIHSLWDRALMHLIRDAVGIKELSSDIKSAISFGIFPTNPFPARMERDHFYFVHESYGGAL